MTTQPFGGIPYSYDEEGNLEISLALGPLSEMLMDNKISVEDAQAVMISQGRSDATIQQYLGSVVEADAAKDAANAMGAGVTTLEEFLLTGPADAIMLSAQAFDNACLLYTSPSPRD